ncbi:putative transcriptional regulator [Kineosphaera limosa]|nr:helix-turn-helix transcriptional regulator [Kineosphaera limosa]NYE00557.1 putative transcriptional regulator [Kineosphaera limosa]
MPNDALINTVRETRRARRMTQADLAGAVGVSRQTIVSIEGGDYAPSVLLALRIAHVLEHPIDQLFAIDHSRLEATDV